MLCEKCQQREATCHITNVTSGSDEAPTTSDLCSECFEASSPAARDLAAEIQAGCCYCGGESFCACPDLAAALAGGHRTRAICKLCWQEFDRVMSSKIPSLGRGSITPKEAANLPAIFSEVHEHMKKWVSDRGSR